MPGIWDHLSAEVIAAGPRRVEAVALSDDVFSIVIHELRVPHAPLLSTDEPPLDDKTEDEMRLSLTHWYDEINGVWWKAAE